MALPTGNISSTQSGLLVVRFSGVFGSSAGDRGAGAWLEIRAFLGGGGGASGFLQTAILRIGVVSTVFLEREYTAGQSVPCGFEYVDHELVGPSAVSFTRCRITWEVWK
jgi:hypothetical protein